jgi:hypothetical protein
VLKFYCCPPALYNITVITHRRSTVYSSNSLLFIVGDLNSFLLNNLNLKKETRKGGGQSSFEPLFQRKIYKHS